MSVRITKNNIYLQVGIRKIKKKSGTIARLIYSVVYSIFCSAQYILFLVSGERCLRKQKLFFNLRDFFF